MTCTPGPDCWCMQLPSVELAADAEACVCKECLSAIIDKSHLASDAA